MRNDPLNADSTSASMPDPDIAAFADTATSGESTEPAGSDQQADLLLLDSEQIQALAEPLVVRARLRHCNELRVTALDRAPNGLYARVEDAETEEQLEVEITIDAADAADTPGAPNAADELDAESVAEGDANATIRAVRLGQGSRLWALAGALAAIGDPLLERLPRPYPRLRSARQLLHLSGFRHQRAGHLQTCRSRSAPAAQVLRLQAHLQAVATAQRGVMNSVIARPSVHGRSMITVLGAGVYVHRGGGFSSAWRRLIGRVNHQRG